MTPEPAASRRTRLSPRRPATTLHLVAAMILALLGRVPAWASDAATAAPGATTSPTSPHPAIQIERRDLDVGTVREGAEVVGTFQIKNAGDAELRILSAKPG